MRLYLQTKWREIGIVIMLLLGCVYFVSCDEVCPLWLTNTTTDTIFVLAKPGCRCSFNLDPHVTEDTLNNYYIVPPKISLELASGINAIRDPDIWFDTITVFNKDKTILFETNNRNDFKKAVKKNTNKFVHFEMVGGFSDR